MASNSEISKTSLLIQSIRAVFKGTVVSTRIKLWPHFGNFSPGQRSPKLSKSSNGSNEWINTFLTLNAAKKSNLESVLEKIEFHQVDIRDYEALEKILNNIDGVFHQAALTVVQYSFTRPEEYHEVNVIGTENISN